MNDSIKLPSRPPFLVDNISKRIISFIPEENKQAAINYISDFLPALKNAHGSSHNHQNWAGGYVDHVCETFYIADNIYCAFPKRGFNFKLEDARLVLFLHDIEKPAKYSGLETFTDKESRKEYRNKIIDKYGFKLNDEHRNALEHIEGEQDYSSSERKMGPLAAFCHMCDIASARIWFDYPAENWRGI